MNRSRRLPRRWSLYFRIAAALLLVVSLAWWFTRDVTYVGNVKVSGLRAALPKHREALRTVAEDLSALVNRMADNGYGWQAGGLPAMRIAGSLTDAAYSTQTDHPIRPHVDHRFRSCRSPAEAKRRSVVDL